MTYFGRVESFNPNGKESSKMYTERLGHSFAANVVADDNAAKKKIILLSDCGITVHRLMCILLAPEKPMIKHMMN